MTWYHALGVALVIVPAAILMVAAMKDLVNKVRNDAELYDVFTCYLVAIIVGLILMVI